MSNSRNSCLSWRVTRTTFHVNIGRNRDKNRSQKRRSMYPEIMVAGMREELTSLGIQELRTASEVDHQLSVQQGTTMVIVNSICGCAAGRMRPAVRTALMHSVKPDRVFTVF